MGAEGQNALGIPKQKTKIENEIEIGSRSGIEIVSIVRRLSPMNSLTSQRN